MHNLSGILFFMSLLAASPNAHAQFFDMAFRQKPQPAAGSDPYFAQVVLLMHMEGANGSTTFNDQVGNAITASSATISTAQQKFGLASGNFPAGAYLRTAVATKFSFGTQDFTIETWAKGGSQTAAYPLLAGCSGFSSNQWGLSFAHVSNSGKPAFNIYNYSTSNFLNSSGAVISDNVWHFITVTRSGSTFRLFVDGTIVASGIWAGSVDNGVSAAWYFGEDGSSSYTQFAGNMDELRITVGVARYTANFTPPTSAFPDY